MTRNELQSKAVESVIANSYNGLIFAATAFGKTKTCIDILKHYNEEKQVSKFLWVVPTTELRDVDIPSEFVKWGGPIEHTDVVCYASLKKIDPSKEYDICILDECHHLSDKRFDIIESLNIKNFVGITATKPEEKERIDLLTSLAPPVFEYSLDEAVSDGIVDDYKITIIEMDLDDKLNYIEAGRKDKRFKTTEKKNYEYLNTLCRRSVYNMSAAKRAGNQRDLTRWSYVNTNYINSRARALQSYESKTKAAKVCLENIYSKDDRVLIMAGRISTANELSEHRYHSGDKKGLESFRKGETNRLSTCKALDEGVNLKDVDSIFITNFTSKMRQLVQRIGRSIRLSDKDIAKIYILCYNNTREVTWLNKALEQLDRRKVTYVSYKNILNGTYPSH